MHFGPAGRRRDLRCLDLRHRQATGSPKRRLLLLLGMQGRENRRKTAVVASLFDGSAYMGHPPRSNPRRSGPVVAMLKQAAYRAHRGLLGCNRGH